MNMFHDAWNDNPDGHRVHVFGPSGSGTSTVGRALATALASQHFDTDDFYWYPTDPPFTTKRPVKERVALMEQMFLPRRDWVLSGSVDSWGEPVSQRFNLAVFLTLDQGIRRARLETRETLRCNCGRGWGQPFCMDCDAFLTWADGYESGDRPGRSYVRHLEWSRTLRCPVMMLDSARPVQELIRRILSSMDQSVAIS